jgi:hypothetical protein
MGKKETDVNAGGATRQKARKPGLNVKLLRRIKKHILEEPRRLMMNWYVATGDPDQEFYGDNNTKQTFPACGTAACIAGWTNLLTEHEPANDDVRARETLGLPDTRELHLHGKDPVFDVNGWPEHFSLQYRAALTAEDRAKIAAERIEHLIKTGK